MGSLFLRTSYYGDDSHPENVRAPLDIGYCISILEEKGFETDFIDMKAEEISVDNIIDQVVEKGFNTVFVQVETPCVRMSKELAEKIKKRAENIDIVFFGQHPSVSPETFLYEGSPIDFCIRGEPEAVVGELKEKMKLNKGFEDLEGVSYFSDGNVKLTKTVKVENLDGLPFPKHSLFLNDSYGDVLPLGVNHRKTKFGYILSSRGCPFDCVYCSPTLRVTYGKRMRSRSAESVVDEIEMLVEKGVNVICFKDDMFTFSEKHVESICDEIIERGVDVNWFVQTRPDCISEKVFHKMREAGCKTVSFGVESGSPRILDLLKKGDEKEDVREAFRLAKQAGLNTVGYFMLGNPTENLEEMKKTLRFAKELKPDMIQVAFFTPYPGSEAYEEYRSSIGKDFGEYHHYNKITYNPSDVDDKTLMKFQKRFYISYFLSVGFLANFLKRKIRNGFDLSLELFYFKKGLKFLFSKS